MKHIPPIVTINRKVWRAISKKSKVLLEDWLTGYGIGIEQVVAIKDCGGEAVIWYQQDGEIYRITLDTTLVRCNHGMG